MATTITTRSSKGSALTHAEMDGNLTALRDTADGAAAAGSAAAAHAASTSNPHGVTKAQVGLGSVDNTSDADKPVSTAQAAAIAAAVTAHEQAGDPHPAYLTQTEAGALYSPTGAYIKPADGVPRQDLDHTIRGQLDLADAALQPGEQLTQAVVSSTTAAGTALMTGADAAAQRAALGLGTAATTASTDYATAVQGAKADAALPATADAIADVLEAAPAADPAALARIRSAVSGDRAALNATQQGQQADGATTALLSADKSSLLDPGGGPAISIKRYRVMGTLAEVLAFTGTPGEEALATDIGSAGVALRWSASGAWRLGATCNLRTQMTQVIGVADTTEQVLGQFDVPAGMLQLCDYWSIHPLWVRSSAAANVTCRVRLGVGSPVSSDAIILSYTQLGPSGLTLPTAAAMQVTPGNTSQVRPVGAQNGLEEWPGIVSGAGFPSPVNLGVNTETTNLKLTATMQAASSGTVPSIGVFILKGHA